MQKNHHLLLFTRFPVAGITKTRLIPLLGPEGAADLQKQLTVNIAGEIQLLQRQLDIRSSVCFCNGSVGRMQEWLGSSFEYIQQPEDNLGKKMRHCFATAFHNGAQCTILVGSDIPDLSAHIIQQGFNCLQDSEIVIGPSQDGGYYLIGCNAKGKQYLLPLLFDHMSWSNSGVLSTTVERLQKAGIAYTLLETLQDIDCPEDYILAEKKGLL